MQRASFGWRRLTVLGAVIVLVAAACGNTGTGTSDKEVTVVGTWGGSEQESFLAMVKPLEDRPASRSSTPAPATSTPTSRPASPRAPCPTWPACPAPARWPSSPRRAPSSRSTTSSISTTYTGRHRAGARRARDRRRQDRRRLHQGRRQGPHLVQPRPTTTARAGDLGRADGDRSRRPPRACGASASSRGAASGWPGTDWIEDIVLRQAGPDVYDSWVAGTVKWTAPEIKSAFEAFGEVVDELLRRRRLPSNGTNFGDGGNPLFTDPPGCLFHHQASFITDFFKEQGGAAGRRLRLLRHARTSTRRTPGPITGGGDLFGMFKDSRRRHAP